MRSCLVLLFLASLGGIARAQPGAPWGQIEPSLGVAIPVGEGFGEAWALRAGPTVRLAAPAYGGWARATVRSLSAEPRDADAPAFALALPSIGWGPEVGLGPVRLSAGPEVGVALFRFDDDESGNLQNETEVAVGAWGSVAVPLGGGARVWAETSALRATLADPVTLVTVGGGVGLRLDAPSWLRRFLR